MTSLLVVQAFFFSLLIEGLLAMDTSSNIHSGSHNFSGGPPDNVTLDNLLTLTFLNPASCQTTLLTEWRLNLSNLDFYCVCYKICVDRALPERYLEEQRRAIIELMGDYHDTFPGAVRTMVSIYSIILLAGITGNLLVLVTVARFLQQPTVTNIFICSLSCADLLVVIVNIPMKIWQLWIGYWYLGKITCHVTHYLLYMTFLASVLTLTAMSIERYTAICRPLRAQYMSTPGRAKRLVVAIWLASLVLGLPTIAVTNYYENTWVCNLVVTNDTASQTYVLYMAGVLFLVPSLVMGMAYTQMSITLWRSLKNSSVIQIRLPERNLNAASAEIKRRLQVIRMLLVVWLVFVLCWAPFMTSLLTDAFGLNILRLPMEEHAMMLRILTCLAYSNSCLNPLLYAFFSANFRRGFRNFLMTCCCGRRQVRDAYRPKVSMSTEKTELNRLTPDKQRPELSSVH